MWRLCQFVVSVHLLKSSNLIQAISFISSDLLSYSVTEGELLPTLLLRPQAQLSIPIPVLIQVNKGSHRNPKAYKPVHLRLLVRKLSLIVFCDKIVF